VLLVSFNAHTCAGDQEYFIPRATMAIVPGEKAARKGSTRLPPTLNFLPLSLAAAAAVLLASFRFPSLVAGSRQKDAFECGCADGAGPTSRRGSHVYEINTGLWNFGQPKPRAGGLSVAKTEEIQGKSRSEAAKQAWATKRARK
jgi:hypothetical protein